MICSKVLFLKDSNAFHWNTVHLSNRPQVSMGYLKVNALSEWIIVIYLHSFTNNEREIRISHEAAERGIENFEPVHC